MASNMYCLSNFVDYSHHIHEPLKHSNRIKYTSFDISEKFVVFGASSGSLYIFKRDSGKFLHLIPNKHGPITILAISRNEKYIAFSTQRSFICVYAINLSAQVNPQVIYTHLGNNQSVQVSSIHWTHDEKQFYFGDTRGQVNLVVMSSFLGHSLLNMTVHPILFLESPIVQIDAFESLLLVSNSTKCILCNTEYEEYKQIGNKPRDGTFGACFAISPNESIQQSRIYCARPGSRVWEVDFEGDVLQTHQFKASLAVPPTKIQQACKETMDDLSFNKYVENDEVLVYQPQTLQFGKIQMLTPNFLLAFTEVGLYIFNMRSSTLVLWCNQFERIADCRVVGKDILVFTQTGSLYSVCCVTLQEHVCALVREEKLFDCASLMRYHVKYFADKGREEYELNALQEVKTFLISRRAYELLNDLSVIFDAIAQCETIGDTNSSGGSSYTAEVSENSADSGVRFPKQQEPPLSNDKSSYILENAFCENLKPAKGAEKHFKDALLTVTGKFGKNIIKYKFNIFAEEQQKVVRDLIPSKEKAMPFKDVSEMYHDDEIVVRTKKQSSQSKPKAIYNHITAEEKTIYNLYLICKSAKISSVNFVERYRTLFDEYSASELISLLGKLEKVMVDHGDSVEDAKKNCFEMYFNYLKPELIWEMDDVTRDYISQGFILLNALVDIVRCENCDFPLRFDSSCLFHEIGEVLLRYYWSRGEQVKCFDVLMQVPAVLDVMAKFYFLENNLNKALPIILNYGKPKLMLDIGKHFDLKAWTRYFEYFVEQQQGRLMCVNCECITTVENVSCHFFYTWNCFLGIALDYLPPQDILALIYRFANYIPNDAIDREFYTKCLLKDHN